MPDANKDQALHGEFRWCVFCVVFIYYLCTHARLHADLIPHLKPSSSARRRHSSPSSSRARQPKVNQGFEAEAEFTRSFNSQLPLTPHPAARNHPPRARPSKLIASAEHASGKAKILLDGRGVRVPGYHDGNGVGAPVI
ncbi:hypothetical protein K438DRAFT_2020107 [Mycena galopus ATCC 62051]|nr:hypothetical protein K438DRAFT_2020107 [Mycena galopus ATCC 62051]